MHKTQADYDVLYDHACNVADGAKILMKGYILAAQVLNVAAASSPNNAHMKQLHNP